MCRWAGDGEWMTKKSRLENTLGQGGVHHGHHESGHTFHRQKTKRKIKVKEAQARVSPPGDWQTVVARAEREQCDSMEFLANGWYTGGKKTNPQWRELQLMLQMVETCADHIYRILRKTFFREHIRDADLWVKRGAIGEERKRNRNSIQCCG